MTEEMVRVGRRAGASRSTGGAAEASVVCVKGILVLVEIKEYPL